MVKVYIILILLFPTIIILNFFIFTYIVNNVIRKFVKPKLQNKKFTFIDYKWLGFFNHGNFKDDKFILLPSLKGGYPVISTYIDVYYSEALIQKKVTVRIDTFFIFIIRVLYSTEF